MRAAAVALSIVLLLGACGDGSSGDALTLVTGASDAAHDARTAHLVLTFEHDFPDGEPVEITFDGDIDLAAQSAKVELDEMEAVAIGDTAWIEVPEQVRHRADGRRWLEYVAPGTGSTLTSVLEGFEGLLATLRDVGEVEDLGEETVNGVMARHFRAVADPDLLAEATGLQWGTSEEAVVELWIGDDRWGEPVDITPPPTDDVLRVDGAAAVNEILEGTDYSVPEPATSSPRS
jgi:hypothetical protein